MYLIYVDESGDVGRRPGSSPYFALSGLVVHELRWREVLSATVAFRRTVRDRYGLKLREELHAGNMISKPGNLARIQKSLRLRLLRDVVDFQAAIPELSVLNVLVEKRGKPADYDVFDQAWRTLIQRFHNTIANRNFPGPQNTTDLGLLVVDKTDEKKLRGLTRRLGAYNPVPNRGRPGYRQMPITTLVEDAVHRDSKHSYFVQLADTNAYFLYQKHCPSAYLRRKGGVNYFDRLEPILCRVASSTNPQGIVKL